MNLLLIIVAIVLVWRVIEGFRVGMVREIISFVSLVVMSVALMLLGIALNGYMDKEIAKVIVAVILFLILCILHRIVGVVFFSAKLISKLPVVHTADRLLGGIVSAETVIIVWVVFFLVMHFGMGVLGQQIILYVQESEILTKLYEHNYLAYWIEILGGKVFPSLII